MDDQEQELISTEQRNRLITVLENLEDRIEKQNSLKFTLLKGMIYGLGTVIGATILVALFGSILAATLNTVVGEEVVPQKLITPSDQS